MTIRVLIIEDSPLVQQWLRRTLAGADDIQVVGALESGSEAHADALIQHADVVLLDLLLPARSGLSLAAELVSRKPVVIVSDSEAGSAMVTEALARGAGAHFTKKELGLPGGAERLLHVIRTLGSSRDRFASRVFALMGSTGALEQHDFLLRALRGLPVSIVLLQHMPPDREATLVEWVAARGWQAAFARHGDPLLPGRVLIAPGHRHLVFGSRSHVAERGTPPVDGHRPSASLLLESGKLLGGDLVGVILSGLGQDGAAGVTAALNAGGEVLAVSPGECAAGSMPRAALAADKRVRELPLADLARQLPKMVGGRGAA